MGEHWFSTTPKNDHLETILPEYGKIVIFLSKVFPHEVLPVNKPRYSGRRMVPSQQQPGHQSLTRLGSRLLRQSTG